MLKFGGLETDTMRSLWHNSPLRFYSAIFMALLLLAGLLYAKLSRGYPGSVLHDVVPVPGGLESTQPDMVFCATFAAIFLGLTATLAASFW